MKDLDNSDVFACGPSILTRGGADAMLHHLVGTDPSVQAGGLPENIDDVLDDVAERGRKIRQELEAEIAG